MPSLLVTPHWLQKVFHNPQVKWLYNSCMQIADIFTGLRFEAPQKRKRVTERGELLSYFQAKINAGRVGTKYRQVSVSQLAFTLSHLKKIDDLRFIKSLCDQEEIRGKEWSMVFYSSLKVKK